MLRRDVVETWLVEAMRSYNAESYSMRHSYAAQLHLTGPLFRDLVIWALQALPDEILVGMDVDPDRKHVEEVQNAFEGDEHVSNLFGGQGYVIKEAHVVNRGDSYSVHHLPEEWTDDLFSGQRGSRAGRFTHWLHTHPNAPAIPSGADTDAAQETTGIDMILGLRFSPEGPLPWFDDVDGTVRSLGNEHVPKARSSWFSRKQLPVLGVAPTGHSIHDIQLIAFHRTGLGVNVILIDESGYPYGWDDIIQSDVSAS